MIDSRLIEAIHNGLIQNKELDKKKIEELKDDPIKFVEYVYGIELKDYQKELMRNIFKNKEINLNGGRLR